MKGKPSRRRNNRRKNRQPQSPRKTLLHGMTNSIARTYLPRNGWRYSACWSRITACGTAQRLDGTAPLASTTQRGTATDTASWPDEHPPGNLKFKSHTLSDVTVRPPSSYPSPRTAPTEGGEIRIIQFRIPQMAGRTRSAIHRSSVFWRAARGQQASRTTTWVWLLCSNRTRKTVYRRVLRWTSPLFPQRSSESSTQ
jgi:hypothetical protein